MYVQFNKETYNSFPPREQLVLPPEPTEEREYELDPLVLPPLIGVSSSSPDEMVTPAFLSSPDDHR